MSSAVQNALQAATAAVSLAAMRLRSKFGIAIAAIMAIIATTIINSISVKPLLFIVLLSFVYSDGPKAAVIEPFVRTDHSVPNSDMHDEQGLDQSDTQCAYF